MRYNDNGFLTNVIGMPNEHADAFTSVARSQKCCILVRATGPTCHGLLKEGYDTKGYRIHGKSCTWGPFAGFVMRDPRLNKYGTQKEKFNREKHDEAINRDHENQGWKASTIPLRISSARVNWLRENGHIFVINRGGDLFGKVNQPGITFNYVLVKQGDFYDVCVDHSGSMTFYQEGHSPRTFHKDNSRYEPLLAMTNPPEHGLKGNTHLKAITGDYDLFAVWPYAENYNAAAGGDDHRPLGTVRGSNSAAERANVDRLERNFTRTGQGTKLGNITNRIYLVSQLINSIVGRNVLWHSDEAARPFLDDVDLPVIAFNPAGSYFGLETIEDFKTYIAAAEADGIRVTLSNAWAQDPTVKHPKRLGSEYARFVPTDGTRIIVPAWYNA